MDFNLAEKVAAWRELYKQRLNLEKLADQIKQGPEALARAEILMYLDAENLQGAKVSGGTISKKTTLHMQLDDTETVCLYMFREMAKAFQEGRPLSDALIVQKTAHKGNVIDIIRKNLGVAEDVEIATDVLEAEAKKLGIKVVTKTDISFSNSKK